MTDTKQELKEQRLKYILGGKQEQSTEAVKEKVDEISAAVKFYQIAQKSEEMLRQVRMEKLAKLTEDLSELRPEIWEKYAPDVKNLSRIGNEIRMRKKALEKASKVDQVKLKQDLKDLEKEYSEKEKGFLDQFRNDQELRDLAAKYVPGKKGIMNKFAQDVRDYLNLDEAVISEGKSNSVKLLEPELRKAAEEYAGNSEKMSKLAEEAEKIAEENALVKVRCGKYLRGGKIVGGAAGVATVAAVVTMVNQGTYNEGTDAALDELIEGINKNGEELQGMETKTGSKTADEDGNKLTGILGNASEGKTAGDLEVDKAIVYQQRGSQGNC